MNPRGFLLFFIFLLSISIVFSQQNVITITEPFSTVYTEINYSQLPNTTKYHDSTNSFMLFDNRRWYVGNLMGTEGQHPTNPQNVSANIYWNVSGSQLKLVAGRQQLTPTYDQSFVFLNMADEFTIKQDSYFHFDMNTSATLDIGLIFLDRHDNCKLIIEGDDTGSSDFASYSYCQGDTYSICAMDNQSNGLGVQSYEVIFSECGVSDLINLKKVAVFTSEGGPGDTVAYIDNLVLGNLYNGSNYMPSVNFTINGSRQVCYNGTEIEMNYNISGYDPENDTILYALDKTYVSPVNLLKNWVDYSEPMDFLYAFRVGYWPDYSYLLPLEQKTLVKSNICPISTNRYGGYNSSAHNVVPIQVSILDLFPNQGLELNSNCTIGNSYDDFGFYYRIEPSLDLFYSTILHKVDGSDNVNISLYSVDEIERFKFNIKHNQTYSVNYISYNGIILGNVSDESDTNKLQVTIDPGLSQFNVTFIGANTRTFNMTYDVRSEPIQYVGIHALGSIIQESFTYTGAGYVTTPAFSSQIPEINVTGINQEQIVLYYSDDAHSTDEYEYTTSYISIYTGENCKYMYNGGVIGDDDSGLRDTDFLEAIRGMFGKNLRQYLVSLGYYETGKSILWIIFIFLILFLTTMGFMSGGNISLTMPLFISSIAVGFLAFMIGYTEHLIVTLLLVAFSLAGPLSRAVGGDN